MKIYKTILFNKVIRIFLHISLKKIIVLDLNVERLQIEEENTELIFFNLIILISAPYLRIAQ